MGAPNSRKWALGCLTGCQYHVEADGVLSRDSSTPPRTQAAPMNPQDPKTQPLNCSCTGFLSGLSCLISQPSTPSIPQSAVRVVGQLGKQHQCLPNPTVPSPSCNTIEQGLGFRAQGLGFRVWGLGFRVRVQGCVCFRYHAFEALCIAKEHVVLYCITMDSTRLSCYSTISWDQAPAQRF